MKRILSFLYGALMCMAAMLCLGRADAAEMVNVEYIHNAIKQKWDITVPYNAALENPRVAANMKYLLTAVDVANEMLNGGATTDYGNGAYATLAAADTVATNTAVDTLVKFEPKFFMTTNTNVSVFKMDIVGAGRFYIDWGDGTSQVLNHTDTMDYTELAHKYDVAGQYEIKMGGRATGYYVDDDGYTIAPIITYNNLRRQESDIARIRGSLGAIFPTIGDGSAPGSQPSFEAVFKYAKNLKGEIPAELFDGVHGQPSMNMFKELFANCSSLEGPIPENLFAGISGAPVEGIFTSLFSGCSSLTGQIPEKLFAGISGTPEYGGFWGAFKGCSSLTGSIPAGLFSGLRGQAPLSVFRETFSGCTGLTGSIPENLFADLGGIAPHGMFHSMFYGCTGLSGQVPGNLFSNFSGEISRDMMRYMFWGCTGLESIGMGLLDSFTITEETNAPFAFGEMFSGCSGLTGPSVQNANGQYLYQIYDPTDPNFTFNFIYQGCTGLSDYADIPGNFGGPAQ